MRAACHEVAAAERATRSLAATQALQTLRAWRTARRVFAFASLPDEIDTAPAVADAEARGIAVAWPYIEGDRIRFACAHAHELVPAARGIPAPPAGAPEATPGVGDVILVPGLAFDATGARLGRGGGHYDRALARAEEAFSAGFGYEFQCVQIVPVLAHDVGLDAVVTDDGGSGGRIQKGSVS